jgi:hypothetical protein
MSAGSRPKEVLRSCNLSIVDTSSSWSLGSMEMGLGKRDAIFCFLFLCSAFSFCSLTCRQFSSSRACKVSTDAQNQLKYIFVRILSIQVFHHYSQVEFPLWIAHSQMSLAVPWMNEVKAN